MDVYLETEERRRLLPYNPGVFEAVVCPWCGARHLARNGRRPSPGMELGARVTLSLVQCLRCGARFLVRWRLTVRERPNAWMDAAWPPRATA